MQLSFNHSKPIVARGRCATRRAGGFTMIEIALSIAVVAFALVAIMGVLPTGMTVQKDNREDTVINQDGRYWIELLKTGARGLEDLTNYVESITITNLTAPKNSITVSPAAVGGKVLSSGDIIGLLSTPKIDPQTGETNRVLARVKAITGPAAEKGTLTNDFSFRYELQAEITPSYPLPASFVADLASQDRRFTNIINYNETLGRNLHDVRLILRWPVVQRGNDWFVGNNKRTFRGRIAGTYMMQTNLNSTLNRSNFLVLSPNRFEVNPTAIRNAQF